MHYEQQLMLAICGHKSIAGRDKVSDTQKEAQLYDECLEGTCEVQILA
jgi:hypothetical protein